MAKMHDFAGKTVLITGASRGIGAEAARVFATAGANVALVARSAEAISALAGEIGDQALAIPCDVGTWWEVARAVEATVDAFGRLDVLIGNAAVIGPVGPMEVSDPEAWGQAIDINLKGVYYGMRAAIPVMLGQGGGTVITVSSGAAHNPVDGWSAYCTSKAGAAMLTAQADKEYRDRGIRVMGLSPGTVATEMQRAIKDSGVGPVAKLDWSVHIPADWPARALFWMCTDAADPHIGTELSLRDEDLRRTIGLID